MRSIVILLALGLLITSASAFPLQGGNGQMNATVYGVIWESGKSEDTKIALVDISLKSLQPTASFIDAGLALVDNDDKFYKPSGYPSASSSSGRLMDFSPDPLGSNPMTRALVPFEVPKDAIIKRLRVNPTTSDPFSIDWEAVPEVSGNDLTMKLYGTSKTPHTSVSYGSPYETHTSTWNFDLKITNNNTQPLKLDSKDFAVLDQFGYEYKGVKSYGNDGTSIDLMPGESMRTSIAVPNVFDLSRPVLLEYDGLKMDIAAWT